MDDVENKFLKAREDIMGRYDPRMRADAEVSDEGDYETEEWWKK